MVTYIIMTGIEDLTAKTLLGLSQSQSMLMLQLYKEKLDKPVLLYDPYDPGSSYLSLKHRPVDYQTEYY